VVALRYLHAPSTDSALHQQCADLSWPPTTQVSREIGLGYAVASSAPHIASTTPRPSNRLEMTARSFQLPKKISARYLIN
jgi:hypothetical protein